MTFKQIEFKVFTKQNSFQLDIVKIHLLLVDIQKAQIIIVPKKKAKNNVLVIKTFSSCLGECNVVFFATEFDCFYKFLRDKVFIVSLL